MKKVIAVLLAALFLAACAPANSRNDYDDITGTVVEKDYDATTYMMVRECSYKYSTGPKKGQCAAYKDVKKVRERENWDVTVKDAAGEEHEIDVTRDVYNRTEIGDPWPPVS